MIDQQHSEKVLKNSLDYSYELMSHNEDLLYHAASFLDTAIAYNGTILKDTDSSIEHKFHQVVANLDNLLEIVAEDVKKVRIKLNSEFGEVNEQAF